MTQMARRSLQSIALLGSARFNVWALAMATLFFVVWLWSAAFQGALRDERSIGLLLPLVMERVCGLFLISATALGWFRLHRAEQIAGLAIGALGILDSWLVAFAFS